MLSIGKWGFFHLYDILIAKDFNPNERTGTIFSKNNFRFLLPEQMRRAILSFYGYQSKQRISTTVKTVKKDEKVKQKEEYVYQCKHCLSIYDEQAGEVISNIPAGTVFTELPDDYTCSLCEAPKEDFIKVEKSKLGLQAI